MRFEERRDLSPSSLLSRETDLCNLNARCNSRSPWPTGSLETLLTPHLRLKVMWMNFKVKGAFIHSLVLSKSLSASFAIFSKTANCGLWFSSGPELQLSINYSDLEGSHWPVASIQYLCPQKVSQPTECSFLTSTLRYQPKSIHHEWMFKAPAK